MEERVNKLEDRFGKLCRMQYREIKKYERFFKKYEGQII